VDRFIMPAPTGIGGSATITDDGRASVAVLPFANMSGNAENEYFSDGLTEADCLAAQGKFLPAASCAAQPCAGYCQGDVLGDGDGDVTLGDFGVLGNNFGLAAGATRADGDANCDGAVNLADFAVLGNNFGCTAPGPQD